MSPEICERIKMHRKRIGLTQEALGETLGVRKSAIQKYESGLTNMKLDTIMQLADVFGISVSSLLGEETSNKKVLELIYENYGAIGIEFFERLTGLNDAGQIKVLEYVQDIQKTYERE